MSRLHVVSFWKSGTTLQDRLFSRYAELQGVPFFKRQLPPDALPDAYVYTCDNLLVGRAFDGDRVLCILRHPLNRLISQYYSYGWTHSDACDWIADPVARASAIERIQSHREEVRNLTLDQYVQKVLRGELAENPRSQIAARFDRHLKHASLQVYRRAFSVRHSNMTLIAYERMMTDPRWFFALACPEHEQTLAQEFDSEFHWSGEDLSAKIVNGESTSHRRTLDHEEFKKKLSPETLTVAAREVSDILSRYAQLQAAGAQRV